MTSPLQALIAAIDGCASYAGPESIGLVQTIAASRLQHHAIRMLPASRARRPA